ncbi:PREDICTED: uncharacterized protein LOC105151059 isoform X1 [Acromyrmex echinatior]|uniref:uncharacterized protein LOC105151059 isoform X1 n=1 Tax=Acromyrmex echinatior TaxID=103372 RepID=UPI000580C9A4|nr:PREDICTED: uncharacterized protein LOC105151059 isoform X1 [Acromyrmex echinatior]XP_011062834.1 PREDICTED: uncharacterized protein LOC105151059 isoform X1 [Acromyrmex echinatior]
MWLRRKENIWITEVIKSESLGLCHQDNGNTIIRDASADWLSALAGVQSAQKITVRAPLADIMPLRPKMRPDVFISREGGCPTIRLPVCRASKVHFATRAITALASRVKRRIINKRP